MVERLEEIEADLRKVHATGDQVWMLKIIARVLLVIAHALRREFA